VNEVLIDAGEFVAQHYVQDLYYFGIPLHEKSFLTTLLSVVER